MAPRRHGRTTALARIYANAVKCGLKNIKFVCLNRHQREEFFDMVAKEGVDVAELRNIDVALKDAKLILVDDVLLQSTKLVEAIVDTVNKKNLPCVMTSVDGFHPTAHLQPGELTNLNCVQRLSLRPVDCTEED